MPANNSNVENENDFSAATDDSYTSLNDSTANAARGVGGTTTASETFDRVGSAASEFNDEGGRPIDARTQSSLQRVDASDAADETAGNSPMSWLVPLIILALLIVLGYWFCGKASTVSTIAPNRAKSAARV